MDSANQAVVDKGINAGAFTVGFDCLCDICNERFTSKTKLFKHLEQHGIESNKSKPVKVSILVGWVNDYIEDSDTWVMEQTGYAGFTDKISEKMEKEIWTALYCLENNLDSATKIPTDVKIERPKGYSRGTSCLQRNAFLLGTEPSCHGCCDTFCFQIKPFLSTVTEWTDKLNSYLPSTIRILHAVLLSTASASEFHSESSCSQRRYEYLLPLRLVMPTELAQPPPVPIIRRIQKHREHEQHHIEQAMDRDWPHDSPEGQARVHFFRNMKKVLKLLSGSRSWHNFATGGACPEEATALRRIDRLYHKEIVQVQGELYVVFSCSGDGFMRGQVRHMIGLAIALLRNWLPSEYLEVALSKTLVTDVPAVPGWGMYIAECKYAFWEAKFSAERLDPRRVDGADCSTISAWNKVVHEHIATLNKQVGDSWLIQFEATCKAVCDKHTKLESLRLRSSDELNASYVSQFGQLPAGSHKRQQGSFVHNTETDNTTSSSDLTSPYSIYHEVLTLLRQADQSGLWPASSTGRQKVIESESLVENGGNGGSFSVGCLPKHLSQPKGNALFPELLLACFKLESMLRPDRPPPHLRDSGAGSGQSGSLICALGDFTGGEVVVEGVAHDIRYKPLEFNGWMQRHWTLPFVGERYSLVWFTPMGVEQEDLYWWKDGQIVG